MDVTKKMQLISPGNLVNKMRVGVIMGGRSAEHEVSFNSGRTVCDHLDTSCYDVVPLFQTTSGVLYILPWHFLHRGKISDFQHRLASEAQRITWDGLKNLIDFMFIAVHGQYAEDGTLQGMLELLGIPYLGSKVFASALAMDKIMQKTFLAQHGIKTARGIHLTPPEIMVTKITEFEKTQQRVIEQLEKLDVQLPYIIKPYKEGSSLGVSVVTDHAALHKALVHACTINPDRQQAVLIEEKLIGMEFSCITITDINSGQLIALPPTEVIPEKDSALFDYEQKYMPGRAHKRTPPHCSDEIIKKIQDTCVATTKSLGITNFSRVDGFVTKNGDVVIIDPNSLSGMDPASFLFREAAEVNMSHSQIINHLIKTESRYYGIELDTALTNAHKNMNNTQKIRVAVLMGGDSNEREISLTSGRNITYKLSPQKYEAIPVFVTENMELYSISHSLLVRNSTKEIHALLEAKDQISWSSLPEVADFVFIGLHGGKGENGSVQGALEMLDMPYNGSSVLTSSLCMDKYKTAQFLHAHGFEIPAEYLVDVESWQIKSPVIIEEIEKMAPYPLIVKPSDDGCSVMVEKVRTREQLVAAINTIFARNKTTVLVEEFVTGMELTVGVIGNESATVRALVPSQTVVQNDILSIEEKFLPGAGENQTPAPLPASAIGLIQETIKNAYLTLGCRGYARIDCFYQSTLQSPTGKERVIILEVNSLPGMTPATCLFHQAAEMGIKPMDFIDQIITHGFDAHKKQDQLTQTECQNEYMI
jgi:D-alanine--D-alanine ligase